MNETIALLQRHRSIRRYKEASIPEEHLTQIVRTGQAASTSSNIQAYSVIAVKDPVKKQRLTELCGSQQYIIDCPVFLVWCADLNKTQTAVRLHEDMALETNVEVLLLGTIDAALAAQNAAVAAESLGYGIVYIGGIRNNPQQVTELLQLPPLVYPVFGMCVGVSDQEPDLRPRLPLEGVYHEEVYRQDGIDDAIRAYDEVTRRYYASRKGGGQQTTWSLEMYRKFNGKPPRAHMHPYLTSQGFQLK
ncbi:oxygen-insensitive NADPH nitroreductase [Paenibacillus sp. PR3]|uniref:Oxygen-insensitive NADPH nitroreductase n=1 Tax=Paenibacillus terricola TaxID=2763503 RepID=A0ABR8MQ99_9BACL|nr:oxygen-insensitive NADPH nitroreductase [Paenibacillus terricola]MBD3918161.1 oxygen-insensitive NADPH nitroreductase [Paenibacillus terricola]